MHPLDFLRQLRKECLNAHSREGDALAGYLAVLLLDVHELQRLNGEASCREFVRSCLDDLQLELEGLRDQI